MAGDYEMKSVLELARAEIGTVEWAEGNNPKVVAYYRDAGHPEVADDATAWCAAFVGAMLHRAGYKGTGSLLARSYLKWGEAVPVSNARPGDIAVIARGNSTWQGHVFFIEKVANGKVYALGGNQRDAVNIQTYPVEALLGVRRAAENEGNSPDIRRKPPALQKPMQPSAPAKPGWLAAIIALIKALLGMLK